MRSMSFTQGREALPIPALSLKAVLDDPQRPTHELLCQPLVCTRRMLWDLRKKPKPRLVCRYVVSALKGSPHYDFGTYACSVMIPGPIPSGSKVPNMEYMLKLGIVATALGRYPLFTDARPISQLSKVHSYGVPRASGLRILATVLGRDCLFNDTWKFPQIRGPKLNPQLV